MRTWLNKDGVWVSNRPDSFYIGIDDYKTGEKLYSTEWIHYRSPYTSYGVQLGIYLWKYYSGKEWASNYFKLWKSHDQHKRKGLY